MKNKALFIFLLSFGAHWSMAQNCQINLKGQILDELTNSPLSFATVFIEELELSALADENGNFIFNQLCAGNLHIKVSHVSCEPLRQFIEIKQDTSLMISLHHHEELLDEVIVHAHEDERSTQNSNTIDKDLIAKESNKNLADILENITGVSSLKSGSSISKPIIHGLYGNRVAILNNGVAQAGQQWGIDHAPEIDPFAAHHISVIKGVAALEYNGGSLGSIVLVEPGNIPQEPHLHGHINYIYDSNGRGHTLNGEMSQSHEKIAWRVIGTLKGIGDQQTPDYFLTNTGRREANLALQLEKDFGEWKSKFYFSSFNSEMGTLRGSHIGNLTDLLIAYTREVPFFTKEEFSYQISPPSQKVHHQFSKLSLSKSFSNSSILNFNYAFQLNDRSEFDVRRGGRSEQAALKLRQFSHSFEGSYSKSLKNDAFFKTGLQWNLIDNTNDPNTGILPLIPDYLSNKTSVFALFQKNQNKLFYEFGIRSDLQNLEALPISRELPRKVERYKHFFPNYGLSAGLKWQLVQNIKFNFNAGLSQRAPAVNELYSFGLHQGLSSIEIGNKNLNSEKAFKLTASVDLALKNKVFIQALTYWQNIQDYIYLSPQNEPGITIRGAFPVFQYEQTNAQIAGLDLLFSYEPISSLRWVSKFSYINGRDISNDNYLIYMPANNFENSIRYSILDRPKWKNRSIGIAHKVVYEQKKLPPTQDILTAPPGYQLLDLTLSSRFQLRKNAISLDLRIENLFNISYRNYLNRQRYFADEIGRNISLRLNYAF